LKSRITAEEGIGFFFGKVNEPPEYDLLIVPSRYSNFLRLDLSDDYAAFIKGFNDLKSKLSSQIPESVDLSNEFLSYIKGYISRKGGQLFGAELSAAVKDSDVDLVQYIVSEILKEWAPKIEITVEFKQVSYQEISAENFMQLWQDFDSEGLVDVLKRPDIADLAEIFPLVDPIRGKVLAEFDVGDPIFFVILNVRNSENLEKLKLLYPKHFSQQGNVIPLPGILVGKELIRGKKEEYYLIKVDMGEGLLGRGLIPKSIKIMSEVQRFEEKITKSQQEWNDKLSQMVSEKPEQQNQNQSVKLAGIRSDMKSHGSDFLIAFLMTLMVLGIILIVSYFFTL
jgi:hypothetical protein